MPKRSRPILAALMLVVTVFLALAPRAQTAPARSATRTLLQNPGFERSLGSHPWMPTDWDTSMADLPTVFFGRDSFLVHGGKWVANIANISEAFPMAHNWSQTLLVGRESWGKVAVFKVWARDNGLEGRAYVMVQAYRDTVTRMARIWNVDRDEARSRLGIHAMDDPFLDLGWKRTQFDEQITDWVQREARAYVPPGTNVLFVRCGLLGIGQVLFDDASLTFEDAAPTAIPAAGVNLLRESGFEDHALAWDIALPPYEGAKAEIDTTVAHSGRASLRLTNFFDGIVQTRIGAGQPFEGRNLRGQHVRLTAWFKGDSLAGSPSLKIYAHGLRTHATQSGGTVGASGTWDWQEMSMEFDIPDDAELVWANCMTYAPARGTLWIDDAKFEVVGPTAKPPKPGAPAKH